jgi:acetyl esterase/lipase
MHSLPFKLLFVFLLQVSFTYSQVTDSSFYYKYPHRPSRLASFVEFVAKNFLPSNKIQKHVENANYVSFPAKIPLHVRKQCQIDTVIVSGRKVFKLSPKSSKSYKTVLFLHGGGYVNNIFKQHWIFASNLVQSTNSTVIIPDYPLAPKSSYSDAFKMLDSLYQKLLLEVNSENIIFIGDSAGGGLALAFAQKLKTENVPQPSQLILIAPWLDVSLTNPTIDSIQKVDPILKVKDLTSIHATWVKDISIKHKLVSPIYGDLTGLPKISIFIGTHDILLADCQSLKEKLEKNKIVFNYFEYPKMLHDWVMYIPLRESKLSIKQIGELLK